ncbi:MAG: class I adenylate-forming enzyme family protein, partial [Sulfurovaceae bacterium]|nr:class I adenylate-forming enzyme family protein [Sulfurovaceae bacterium]
MNTIVSYLKKIVQSTPNKIFLRDEERIWSFQDFYDDAARFSTFLLNHGIQNGDFVIIHLDKKIEHLITYVALLNIGAISVHTYPEREDEYIEFAIKHTKAKAVISNKFAGNCAKAKLFEFVSDDTLEPTYKENANDIAYIMFTSGTTSSPKAVVTTQKNVIFVTKTLIELAQMRQGHEREIILLPLGSTGGLGHFHACMFLGNYARLYPGFYANLDEQSITVFLDTLAQEKITGVLLTPGIIGKILKSHKAKFKKMGMALRYVLANVMPMKKETIKELLDLLPNLRFCTYYGSTEASRSIVNVCRENIGFEHTTGRPANGVAIRIDKQGEIFIRGDNVMKGYLYEEDKTLQDGWFATGDIGFIDNQGYITVLGRAKETISLDGLKVFPHEVESIITTHKSIYDVGVSSVETEIGADELCMAIVTDDLADKDELSKEIVSILKKHFKIDKTNLYSYKIPSRIYFVKLIPRTDLGKIKRGELSKILLAQKDF